MRERRQPHELQVREAGLEDEVRGDRELDGVGAGQHLVEIQWRTGTPASIRDRTLTVYSASASAKAAVEKVGGKITITRPEKPAAAAAEA